MALWGKIMVSVQGKITYVELLASGEHGAT